MLGPRLRTCQQMLLTLSMVSLCPPSAQPATAYPAAAPATYVAQPAHAAAYVTATPRAAQSYDAYQTTQPAGQFAYATRTQVVVGVSVTRGAPVSFLWFFLSGVVS